MKAFLARLNFSVSVAGKTAYEEQLRLIIGISERDAFSQATHLGNSETEELPNIHYGFSYWHFIGVSELKAIDKLEHGIELDSRTINSEANSDFDEFIKQKVLKLQSDFQDTNKQPVQLFSA
jgi:hypothetical protein